MKTMANARDGDDPPERRRRLVGPTTDDVGYGKPPVSGRFRPGQSGNPKGRPKGAKNRLPSLSEERIKTLIMEEAYRTIPILENGRRVSIPMIAAVLRAVAMNAAKGNNRAALLFTTLVSKTEAENKKLAIEAFGSAITYKNEWSKELERRKRLGLDLPDPVPHPDDIILDARKMDVRIAGPWTREEIPRYKLAAEFIAAYQEAAAELTEKVSAMPDGPERGRLCRTLQIYTELVTRLTPHYGPRSERTKDALVRDAEDIIGAALQIHSP